MNATDLIIYCLLFSPSPLDDRGLFEATCDAGGSAAPIKRDLARMLCDYGIGYGDGCGYSNGCGHGDGGADGDGSGCGNSHIRGHSDCYSKQTQIEETKMSNEQPKLILDTHMGIYCGVIEEMLDGGAHVRVRDCRHCYYYAVPGEGHEGTYGLATVGPAPGSKIGPKWSGIIRDVSKIVDLTPEAIARWQAAKWG